MMTLKPFRDYSEHNVVNLFALNEGSGNKGEFVKLLTFDPDNHSNFGASMPGVPSYAWAKDYVVNARVALTTSGATPFGMLLFDVRTVMPYPVGSLSNVSDPVRLAEQQLVISGRAVPIVTKGIFELAGFEGVPGPGSGAYASNTTAGGVRVAAGGSAGQIGTWLSSSGVDGAALLKINL